MILIIGGGISGLTLAYELEKKGIEYLLLESGAEPGGYMKSQWVNKYLLELGPNTVLANSELKAFFYELGLNDQVLIPEEKSKKRYVYKNGALKRLPSGPFSFLFGNFFSWKTKKAIFNERKLLSSGKDNETVGEFFERRFTKELVDYAVNPFVSGIFAGDPYRLLVDKTFPFLADMEKKYGSVVKGFMKSKSGAVKKESVIFKNGINGLVKAIADHVHHAYYSTKVLSIRKNSEGLEVDFVRNKQVESRSVDQVVITSPSFAAADILQEYKLKFSEKLSQINYCPMVKVFMGFKKKDIGLYPDGYGVLNPACEGQFSLGTIYNSSINPFSCPEDRFLFTVMVGGVSNEKKTEETDGNLMSKVSAELKRVYKITSNPDFMYVHRIPKAIPQYDINMSGLDVLVDELEEDGIFICANWHKGASVSDCIKKASKLSEVIKSKCPCNDKVSEYK